MNFEKSIAQRLVDEMLDLIHQYDETMLLPTALGCLDVVRHQLITDAVQEEEE